jgi:trans-2,3-dihydro-3-hydroxyanthranilate isomerase
MTTHPYVTVDVFTDRRFGGNPLAVLTDARGLDTAAMQAVAAEFGYAETTFVLPPADPANTAAVRIFTPQRELPFAGHPNVGTAFVLATAGAAFGRPVGDELVFEEAAGLVPVSVRAADGVATGATVTAPQPLQRFGTLDPEAVAACVGLAAADIDMSTHRPLIASVGTPFAFAALRDSAAVSRCAPDPAQFHRHLAGTHGTGLHVYARSGAGGLHCRMFAPLAGVPEDPATGSAAAALAALLAELSPGPDGELAFDIRQGAEMGRPSRLYATVLRRGGRALQARVGGACVAVMEGRIAV